MGDAGEAARMILTMAVLSSVGLTGLEPFVSSSLDAVETWKGWGEGEVIHFVEGDSRRATLREKMAVSRGGKLCPTFIFTLSGRLLCFF